MSQHGHWTEDDMKMIDCGPIPWTPFPSYCCWETPFRGNIFWDTMPANQCLKKTCSNSKSFIVANGCQLHVYREGISQNHDVFFAMSWPNFEGPKKNPCKPFCLALQLLAMALMVPDTLGTFDDNFPSSTWLIVLNLPLGPWYTELALFRPQPKFWREHLGKLSLKVADLAKPLAWRCHPNQTLSRNMFQVVNHQNGNRHLIHHESWIHDKLNWPCPSWEEKITELAWPATLSQTSDWVAPVSGQHFTSNPWLLFPPELVTTIRMVLAKSYGRDPGPWKHRQQ